MLQGRTMVNCTGQGREDAAHPCAGTPGRERKPFPHGAALSATSHWVAALELSGWGRDRRSRPDFSSGVNRWMNGFKAKGQNICFYSALAGREAYWTTRKPIEKSPTQPESRKSMSLFKNYSKKRQENMNLLEVISMAL